MWETQTVSFLVAFSLIALSVAVRAPKAGLQALVQQAQAAPELWALLRRRPQCSYTCSEASATSHEPTTLRRGARLTEAAVPPRCRAKGGAR